MRFAPKELEIDCSDFTETMLWRNYNDKTLTSDPVIPFLQEFLSSVEELELRHSIDVEEPDYDDNYVEFLMFCCTILYHQSSASS